MRVTLVAEREIGMREQAKRRGARAIAVRRRRPEMDPWGAWWLWAALAAAMLAAVPGWAQAPVAPQQREAPTLPPGSGGDQGLTTPRSETPDAPTGDARPVPDTGVVTPPPATGSTPVIRPPAAGTMPVIRPPGTPGGNPNVVPK